MIDDPNLILRFKKQATNTGALTINGLRAVPVIREDGTPVNAGDLIKGKEYFVELETGILHDKKAPDKW